VSLIIKASEQSLNAEIRDDGERFLSVLLSFLCVSSLNRSLFSIADPCRPLDTLALDIDRTCNGASIVHIRKEVKNKTKTKKKKEKKSGHRL
jgi:hypothetical protein